MISANEARPHLLNASSSRKTGRGMQHGNLLIFDYSCPIPSTSSALHVSVIPLAGVHPRQRGVSWDIKPQYLLLKAINIG